MELVLQISEHYMQLNASTGEASEVVDQADVAVLEVGDTTYIAVGDDCPPPLTPFGVYRVNSVPATTEQIVFNDEQGNNLDDSYGDDEGDDEGDDDDEPGTGDDPDTGDDDGNDGDDD